MNNHSFWFVYNKKVIILVSDIKRNIFSCYFQFFSLRNNNFNNITGNLFEALVGAVYLDKGYDVAADFIMRSYKQHIKMDKLLRKEQNYKSMLLEWCQKERKEFYYELVEETRIEDNKIRFQSRVIVDGRPMGFGVANSKRESEQAAAKQALQTLKD